MQELVQKYDTKSWSWTEVAGMLIPRSGSAACVLNGQSSLLIQAMVTIQSSKSEGLYAGYIYVVGGWHASTENTNKVERYDVARNLWEVKRLKSYSRFWY